MNKQTKKYINKQTNEQTNKQTNKETNKEINKQRIKLTNINTFLPKQSIVIQTEKKPRKSTCVDSRMVGNNTQSG